MDDVILFAHGLSGPVRGKTLRDRDEVIAALRAPELAWLHLRANDSRTAAWAGEHLAWLDPLALVALLAEETRPRATPIDAGVLVILRGVNLNPDSDPEDMVSVRMYIDPARIVSMSVRDLVSVSDLHAVVAEGRGPDRAGSFLCALVDRLNDRISTFLHELDEECDDIEEVLIDGPSPELRGRIAQARRRVILFRRHIGPQRDALGQLARNEDVGFLDKTDRRRLAEAYERLTRVIEEADALRDRLGVVRDELQNALSERLNRNLYMLSVISVVFLPLSFLTGLLGTNVGGIPGNNWPFGFWVVSAGLVTLAGIELAILRRLRWI